ncbi:MAG: helix-turn-helix domain-containing protein [Thermomicrobiales bacterium]
MTIDRGKLGARSMPVDDYLSAQLGADPGFRAYWERTAFARALSLEVIRARAALQSGQVEFAERMGAPLAVVEALEEGEDDPSVETLSLLAERVGIPFAVTVTLAVPQDTQAAPPVLHTRLKRSAA